LNIPDLGRKHDSDSTRMRELKAENSQLKKMSADVSLQNMALKDIDEKKAIKPAERKALAQYAIIEFGLGVMQASDAVSISPCTYYYQPKLVDAVSELAHKHTNYGFRKNLPDYL